MPRKLRRHSRNILFKTKPVLETKGKPNTENT